MFALFKQFSLQIKAQATWINGYGNLVMEELQLLKTHPINTRIRDIFLLL